MKHPKERITDVALEELVFYRVLTLRQIMQLATVKSEKWARQKMEELTYKGYCYQRYLSRVGGGRDPSVYQLLPEGKKLLQENGIEVPYVVHNLQKLQSLRPMHLLHTVGVNDIFIMLSLLAKQHPGRFQFIKRIHERSMSRYTVSSDGWVEPDGFVSLKVNRLGKWKPQSFFIEYERTTAYADMGDFQQKIRNYLTLFDDTGRLEILFEVRYPSLMIVVDNPARVPILAQYCAETLQRMHKQDQESRFLVSALDITRTPVQFFCSPWWLRSWLPLPPPVPFFTNQEDLLYSSSQAGDTSDTPL